MAPDPDQKARACPFCTAAVPMQAAVCGSCGRTIVLPEWRALCSYWRTVSRRRQLEAWQTFTADQQSVFKASWKALGYDAAPEGGEPCICLGCGSVGAPLLVIPGSAFIQVLLLLVFCLPGIIYSAWRYSRQYRACAFCGQPTVIPLGSPEGIRLLAAQRREIRDSSSELTEPQVGAADVPVPSLEQLRPAPGRLGEREQLGVVVLIVVLLLGTIVLYSQWRHASARRLAAASQAANQEPVAVVAPAPIARESERQNPETEAAESQTAEAQAAEAQRLKADTEKDRERRVDEEKYRREAVRRERDRLEQATQVRGWFNERYETFSKLSVTGKNIAAGLQVDFQRGAKDCSTLRRTTWLMVVNKDHVAPVPELTIDAEAFLENLWRAANRCEIQRLQASRQQVVVVAGPDSDIALDFAAADHALASLNAHLAAYGVSTTRQ